MRVISTALALTIAFAPQGGVAQRANPPQATLPSTATEPSDDIVVTGLADLDAPGSAVTRKTLGSGRVGTSAIASRTTFEISLQFAACAFRKIGGDEGLLRQAVDSTINSSRQRFAQQRFVQRHASCAPSPAVAIGTGLISGASGYGTSYYDRGALFIAALQHYRPGLSLTAKQTADPAVQKRFDRREIALARFRLPLDRQYFEIAVCLVRLQPQLSVRLAMSDRADLNDHLAAGIVNGARICTGNAKQVYFDPSQFRFYIADAVYRWAVAAEGVTTLIPDAAS